MTIIYKKRIRLKDFDYKGSYRYFVTLCAEGKKEIFTDKVLVEWFVDVLRDKSKHFGFKIWAWCFMPNHLHLLLEGKDCGSDVRRFISSYKQHTAFYYKKNVCSSLWQHNFYEHVLRKEEDTVTVVRYIFDNPVRKGFVDDYMQYRFSGSFELEFMEL